MTERNVYAIVLSDDASPSGVAGLIAAASAIGVKERASVTAILIGQRVSDSTCEKALAAGADAVWLVSHPGLRIPADTDQLIAALCHLLQARAQAGKKGSALFLTQATPMGDEIAARLANRLGGVPIGRCVSFEFSEKGFVTSRQAFGARVTLHISVEQKDGFGAIHPLMVDRPASNKDDSIPGQTSRFDLDVPLPASLKATYSNPDQTQVPLSGAKIVVGGGRGIGGPEGFALLKELADNLGAAVSGSLPTVDAGWIPSSLQVGQSGNFIAPSVYLTFGISGTPQHLAGVDRNTKIIAVNRDPDASIFKKAEIGIVADWQEVVPGLIDQLHKRPPVG